MIIPALISESFKSWSFLIHFNKKNPFLINSTCELIMDFFKMYEK